MSQQTRVALSAVFPLVLVTIAIEHWRAQRFVQRHERVWDKLVEYSMIGALLCLGLSVVGVEIRNVHGCR